MLNAARPARRATPGCALLAAMTMVLLSASLPSSSPAGFLPREGNIIGVGETHLVRPDESLYEIARRYDLGYSEIASANPGFDPFLPTPGRRVTLPTERILPDATIQEGIVINLPEMRLFVLSSQYPNTVVSFPVGIGDLGMDTPTGNFTVIEKIRDPEWRVPRSIRKEDPSLPAVVPPGPDNPMGSHALRLSTRSILIHGTNRPWGIGTRGSHGCIRLYPEDIPVLFDLTRRGTPVEIVNQPVKAARLEDRVYLEIHDYMDGKDLLKEALQLLSEKKLLGQVDLLRVREAVLERTGLLVDVTE